MKNLILANADFASPALVVVIIAVGILLGVAMLFAIITKIVVAIKYLKYNKIICQKGVDALTLTQSNLNYYKLNDVKVVKANWIRSLLGLNVQSFGNSYSAFRKKIYLRKNIISKASVTAYAVSTQKVAHAYFHNEKKYTYYYKLKPLMLFAPVLLIPFIIVGLLLDIAVGGQFGFFTILMSFISLGIFALSFVLLLVTIPIEKKANLKAQEILAETNSVTSEEMKGVKKVHNAFVLSYIADFIYALIQIIWDILKLVLKAANATKKK